MIKIGEILRSAARKAEQCPKCFSIYTRSTEKDETGNVLYECDRCGCNWVEVYEEGTHMGYAYLEEDKEIEEKKIKAEAFKEILDIEEQWRKNITKKYMKFETNEERMLFLVDQVIKLYVAHELQANVNSHNNNTFDMIVGVFSSMVTDIKDLIERVTELETKVKK